MSDNSAIYRSHLCDIFIVHWYLFNVPSEFLSKGVRTLALWYFWEGTNSIVQHGFELPARPECGIFIRYLLVEIRHHVVQIHNK